MTSSPSPRLGVGGMPAGAYLGLYLRALAVARGDALGALAFVEGQRVRNETAGVVSALKTLVDPQGVADISAATRAVAFDFAQLLRAASVTGRLVGMRRVPFTTRMLSDSSGASADWTAEGEATPLGKMNLTDSGVQLPLRKVSGIAVVTQELTRASTPVADALLARDVVAAIAEKMDSSFVDPASGETSKRPASITHNAQSFESTGASIAAVDSDLQRLAAVLTDADLPLATAQWIMHPRTATSLALLRGSGGAPAFPGVHARGGELLGLPVLVTTACNASGSPGERFIVLAEANEILLGDDEAAEISVTTEAALQMDDAPAAGAQQLVSLWQSGLVGVMGSRWMNWKRRRAGAVAVLRSVGF